MGDIKEIIYSIITAGRGNNLEFPVKRKVILINIFLIILFVIFIFFTILNFFQFNLLLLTIDIISLFLIIISFFMLRITLMLDVVSNFFTLIFGLVLIFFLVTGGRENSGPIYLLVYPALAFFLLGKRKGMIVVTLFTLSAILSYLIFMNCSWFPDYKSSNIIRLIVMYTFILLLAYSYEYVFNKINSELEETHQWLTHSEEEYKILVENANIGILIIKSDKVVFSNNFFSRMTGHIRESLIGKKISDILNQDDFEKAKSMLRTGSPDGEDPESIESTITTHEGKSLDVDINVLKIDYQMEPALLVIIYNISKKKSAEREREKLITQLNEVLSLKDRFISVLAHDLKGPLGSYFEFMEFFETNYDEMTDEDKKDIITSIKVSSKNNYNLLLNLLNWARLQNNKMPFNPEILSLKEVISEITGFYHTEAERKKLKIISNINPKLYLFCDSDMINIIMKNLISNAIKYSYEKGSIRIIATELKGYVKIEVSDNGKGMKSELLADLFNLDIYSRGKPGSGKMSSGLGLILSRDMIEKNGGQIWVESKEGKGTTFTFTLPGDYNEIA